MRQRVFLAWTDSINLAHLSTVVCVVLTIQLLNCNGEHSIFLLQNFLLHKIKVALKSLWSFCDLVETSNINNESKASAPHCKKCCFFRSTRPIFSSSLRELSTDSTKLFQGVSTKNI